MGTANETPLRTIGLRGIRIIRAFKQVVALPLFAMLRLLAKQKMPASENSVVIPEATFSPWRSDAAFKSVHREIRENTYVDVYRLYELWQLAGQVASRQGDVLEVGVWRGGTGCMIARRIQELGGGATVHLCDTFEGVAKAGPRDPVYRGGEHADTSEALVTELANKLGLRNVELHKGMFPDDTALAIADRTFSLCHVDVDTYGSALQVTEWVWDRLLPGGIVVYDDYGFSGTRGVTDFVHEFMARHDCVMIHNLNGHAVLIKR